MVKISSFSYKFFFAILLFFVIAVPVFGQTSMKFNRNNPSAQLLSDSQLNSFWSNAKKLGYDYTKILITLQEGGFSYIESQSIVDRIRQLEESKSGDPFSILQNLPEDRMTAFEKKIYGFKLFYQSEFEFPDFNFMPAPPNYQLGVGDELTIVLFGETDANYLVTVEKDGKIRFPFIGPIHVLGLSFESAKSLIKQNLSVSHKSLLGRSPSVFLDMVLTNSRNISVSILGEVNNPGSYSIPFTSSLFNLLYKAGGPTVNGTLRQIKVYRGNLLIYEMDLYNFIQNGFSDNTFSFQEQDVVVVNTYKKRIEILGAIRNSGLYEIINGESITNLIATAGGFSSGADKTTLTLRRLNGPDQFITSIDTAYDVTSLMDGDILVVPTLRDYNVERIEITGAVKNPGFFNFNSNITLDDLINSAGGLRSDALKSRVSVFQIKENLDPSISSVNLDLIDPSSFLIHKRSKIYIPSLMSLIEPGFVSIEGSVSRSGEIPFYSGMTALDAIVLADGILNSAREGKVEVARRNPKLENGNFDFFLLDIPLELSKMQPFELQDRDRIYIRDNWLNQDERIITVEGEIHQPGKFVINAGVTRISEIIQRAGGPSETANIDGFKLYRLVKSVNDKSDSTFYERKRSIAQFLNDPRFEGSVSTLQYDLNQKSFNKLENDRIIYQSKIEEDSRSKQNQDLFENDSLGMVNNFKLTKNIISNNKNVQLLEIGLSYSEILLNPQSQYNITLLDGDILFVPAKTSLVEIDGEVFNPTQSIYRSNKSFRNYITNAGGFKKTADRNRTYIMYSNGEIERTRSFLFIRSYPKVLSDSQIFVPEKQASDVINFDRFISLLTTTISTYLLIVAVTNN